MKADGAVNEYLGIGRDDEVVGRVKVVTGGEDGGPGRRLDVSASA